jgi:hypothetical protein
MCNSINSTRGPATIITVRMNLLKRLLLRSSFSNGGTSVSKYDFHLYDVLINYLTDCMVLRSEQNHKRMVVLKNTMYECSEAQAS